MSYILDALRRAEAQRSRGAVPTLHAPVLDAGPQLSGLVEPARRRWLIWLLLGVAGVVVVLLAWRLAAQRPVPTDVAAQPPRPELASNLPTGPVPAAPSMAMAESALRAVQQPPSATAPVVAATNPPSRPAFGNEAPRSVGAPSASESGPSMARRAATVADASQRPKPVITLRSDEPPPPLPAAPTTITPSSGSPAAPSPTESVAQPAVRRADAAIPARRDLPPEVQRELPALAVSGMVYSADRAQRMLMVNGELLREGDRIGPDLVLEEIRRKEAVLRYKGQRFSISP